MNLLIALLIVSPVAWIAYAGLYALVRRDWETVRTTGTLVLCFASIAAFAGVAAYLLT